MPKPFWIKTMVVFPLVTASQREGISKSVSPINVIRMLVQFSPGRMILLTSTRSGNDFMVTTT
jgi:hypothetical protein